MRLISPFLFALGLLAMGPGIVASPSFAAGEAEEEAVGQVAQQVGPVTALRDLAPRVLHLGALIYKGDRLVTGADAKVEIRFRDGSSLSLGSHTDVEINEFLPEGRKRGLLSLIFGIIRTSLTGQWDEGFEIRTRAAVASVRATDWVTVMEKERASVFVVTGEVEVKGLTEGTKVTLPKDFGTDVPVGGKPSPPKKWGRARVDEVLARSGLP